MALRRPKITAQECALRLLSARDRTVFELRAKLQNKDFPPAEIDTVMSNLQETKVISDARFVENYLREMTNLRPCSLSQSQFRLRARGIAPELVIEKWQELALSEEELAQKVTQIKLRVLQKNDPKFREKLARHLAGRGFSWGIIQKILRDLKT